MALRTWLYIAAIFGIIALYKISNLNLLYLLIYPIVLLLADLVPKRLVIEAVLAAALMGTAVAGSSYGLQSYAPFLIALLLILPRLPGVLVYSAITLGFSSISAVGAVNYVSGLILLIIIAIHVAKFLLERVFKFIMYIPIINLIPWLLDVGVNLLLAYILFSNITVLSSLVQNAVNAI